MEDHPIGSRVPHLVTKMTEEDKLRILLVIGLCIWLPALTIFIYFYIQDFIKRRKQKSGLETIVLKTCGESLIKTKFGRSNPKTNDTISQNHHQKPKAIIELKTVSSKESFLVKNNCKNMKKKSKAENIQSKHEVPTTSCCTVNEKNDL